MWGINVIVMKLLMEQIPLFLLAGSRVVCSSAIIALYMLHRKETFKISYKNIKWLLIISFFNVGLNFYLSFNGMLLSKGTSTAIINALNPVVTCLFAYVLLKEKLSKKKMIAVLLSLLGFIVSIQFRLTTMSEGSFFLIGSLLSYSFSTILVKKKVIKISSLQISFYSLLFGSLQLLLMSYLKEGLPLESFVHLSLKEWVLFISVSICGFAFIQFVQMEAVKRLGPANTSFYLNLNPIFTYITSLLFLKEKLDYYQVIGFTLMLISLFYAREKGNKTSAFHLK